MFFVLIFYGNQSLRQLIFVSNFCVFLDSRYFAATNFRKFTRKLIAAKINCHKALFLAKFVTYISSTMHA